MNSNSLKKEFPNNYKDFFSINELIVSTPFVINRSGDIHSKYSGISIKQKLPLRLYFGISKNKDKRFTFGDMTYYDSGTNTFIQTTCYNYAPYFSYIEKYLNESYSYLLGSKTGYTISVFSEISRGIGIGFNPLITLLSSVVVNYLDPDVEVIKEDFESDLFQKLNEKSSMRKIILDSIKFDFLISPYPSITTKICSLAHGYYPIIGFREDGINYTNLDDLILFAYRFNELRTNLIDIPYLPFDFSVLYCGKPVIGEQLIASDKTHSDRNHEKHKELFDIFNKRLKSFTPKKQPKFYKNFILTDSEVVTETYGDMMGAISMEVLQKMSKIFGVGFNDGVYHTFINSINKIRYGNMIIRKNSKEFIDFITNLLDVFGQKKELIGVVPNDTTAMGGTITIVSPLEVCRGTLNDVVDRVCTKYYGASLLYCNWIDGICNEGLKVEQDLSKGFLSNIIENNKHILLKSDGTKEFGDLLELRKSTDQDIILDLTNGKIFINGDRITSEEIVSQQTTVELMLQYRINGGEAVSNKNLSPSTFSKNKNEMINKILTPFKKLIKNKIDKNIEFECSGDNSRFYISLNLKHLHIGFISNIESQIFS